MKVAYVVRWQSPCMTAPAFWYFSTLETAERVARSFRTKVGVTVAETLVADTYDFQEPIR